MKDQLNSSTKLINMQLAIRENVINRDDITIREFLVYQQALSSGEFGGTSACYKNSHNLSELAEESSEHLLSRMILHFHHVCMRAREVHVQQNFPGFAVDDVSVNTEMPINVNAITRVVFSEFSFYPYQKRGPLTFDELHKFCEKFVEAASEYPINMHMCISSMPVCDANNDVFNVAVYLQCGSKVRINVFAKAVPDEVDPIYDDTRNACYATFNHPDEYINKINSSTADLVNKLIIGDLKAIRIAVDGLLAAIGSTPDFLLDKRNEIDRNVVNIKRSCEKIIDYIANREAYTRFNVRSVCFNLINSVSRFVLEVEKKSKKRHDEFKNWMKAAPMQQASAAYHDHSGRVIYRGGLVECVTAGGVDFVTAIDICFDYCFDVAAKLYQRYLENCLRDNRLITPYLSYIVTSNTIQLESFKHFCGTIVHCDAYFSSILYNTTESKSLAPAKREKLAETAFGSSATIEVYPPYILRESSNELRGRVEYYNKMIRERRAHTLEMRSSPHFASLSQSEVQETHSTVHLMRPNKAIKHLLVLLLPEIKQKFDDVQHPFAGEDFIAALDKIKDLNMMVLGNSLLQWSITNDIEAVFEIMYRRKDVNLQIKNIHGYTAFDLAVMYNRIEIATQLYGVLIEGSEHAITSSQLSSASKELKAVLLTAAIAAEREFDIKYFLGIGADLFLMSNYTRPMDMLAKHYSDSAFEIIYHHVKLSNKLNLFSTVTLFNLNKRASVLLIELCCRDRLDHEVDFIIKMKPDLYLSTSDIKRLHQLIDLNSGSELSHIIKTHLIDLGYQYHDIDELVEKEQVKHLASFSPFKS